MFDKYQMMEGIINLLNTISVTGAQNVLTLGEVFKMLSALRKGLKEEEQAKKKQIDNLTETIKKLQQPQIEENGDVVGGEHYDIKFSEDDNEQTEQA